MSLDETETARKQRTWSFPPAPKATTIFSPTYELKRKEIYRSLTLSAFLPTIRESCHFFIAKGQTLCDFIISHPDWNTIGFTVEFDGHSICYRQALDMRSDHARGDQKENYRQKTRF